MTTVFIAGSINIRKLDAKVEERIDNIINSGFDIVVGDAEGADTSIQKHLFRRGACKITIFCSGGTPRNNVGAWPVRVVESTHLPGTRAFFTAKDLVMAQVADFGLMVWDAKSTGTLSNVIELLTRNKKCVVYVNKEKIFQNVTDADQFEELLKFMSDHAKMKAEEKIHVFRKLDAIKNQQRPMFT